MNKFIGGRGGLALVVSLGIIVGLGWLLTQVNYGVNHHTHCPSQGPGALNPICSYQDGWELGETFVNWIQSF